MGKTGEPAREGVRRRKIGKDRGIEHGKSEGRIAREKRREKGKGKAGKRRRAERKGQ